MENADMWFDKECQGCGHRGLCHSIYYRLGHAEGPSVLSKVLLAFGIPVVVFIVTLTGAGMLFGGILTRHAGPVLLSLALALTLTALAIAAIWWLTQRPADRGDQADEVQR
jgi:hypothetical protein